mgnify:CR=1 FL=1
MKTTVMKIKLLLIIFALFGSQLGFAQEIKAVAVDSAETVAMDLTKQKIADKEALKEKKIADKALKDAERDRKRAEKENKKTKKRHQKAEKKRTKNSKKNKKKREKSWKGRENSSKDKR